MRALLAILLLLGPAACDSPGRDAEPDAAGAGGGGATRDAGDPAGGGGRGGERDAALCADRCSGSQTCDETGRCVEPVPCDVDADCFGGRLCHGNLHCEPICRSADCPRRDLCRRVGCLEPRACVADADCPNRSLCSGGLCYPACRGDMDCAGRQTCGAEGRCEEPPACESHRDCKADRICRDDACVEPEAPECRGSNVSACPGGERAASCGPSGQCGPRRVCGEDSDCQNDRCGPAGRCAPCDEDGGCAGSQRCELGGIAGYRCVEPRSCLSDEDCLRQRVCQPRGACGRNPVCAGDRFDGHHLPTVPADISDAAWTGLSRCDEEDDWYRLILTEAFGLEAVLVDRDDVGLVLELRDGHDPSKVWMSSDTAGPGERVGTQGGGGGGPVLLKITGPPGAAGAYDLDIRLTSPDTCNDDVAELWGGDDDAAHATTLVGERGEIHGRRFCGDADWYRLTLTQTSQLTFQTRQDARGGLLTLLFSDSSGRPPENQVISGPELLIPAVRAGNYFLQVAGIGQGAGYSLEWFVEPDPGFVRTVCMEAELLDLDQAWEGQILADDPNLMKGSCAAEGQRGPEAVARLHLGEATDFALWIAEADFDPIVYLRRDCALDQSEFACGSDPAKVFADSPGASSWFVVVEAKGEVGEGRFTARMVAGELVGPGENESCEFAAPIFPDLDGHFNVAGDTSEADGEPTLPSCAPFGDAGASPDLWYRISIDEDSRLTATLEPEDWDAVLHLQTGPCNRLAELSCGDEPSSITIPRLSAGDHYLVVDGYQGGENGRGRYTLHGLLEPPEPPPPNDTCETAHLLVPDPDTGVIEVPGDTGLASDRGEVPCALAASRLAPDLFYRFQLGDRSDVVIEVDAAGGYAPAVELRTGECRGGAGVVCRADAPWSVGAAGLAAGEYLIVVDGGRPEERGEFTLRLEVVPSPGG